MTFRDDDLPLDDDLRALVDEIRDAAPRPEREPAWDDMARSIRAACDDVRPGLLARAAAWLRARPLATGGICAAVAAAAILLALRAGDATAPTEAPTVATAAPIADDLRDALPTLSDAWESDAVDAYAMADDDDDELSEWLAVDVGAGDDDDLGLGFDLAPIYDDLLDDLTDEELDALADSLATGRPS